MRKIKNLSIYLAVILLNKSAFAQTNPQNNIKLFFEKVFVHTDRSVYTAGEDIWFKAYVTNAQDNHLISTSKNLYVELISPGDTIANKAIVYINNGTGKGDFALSGQLATGSYKLRAYTNWQRNFGDNFIFEKTITITGVSVVGKANVKAIAKVQKKGAVASSAIPSVPTIQFFPEGGSLVNDISSIVAVKAEDATGKGISISGPVISATGDTVAKFTCDSLGMGLFVILPIAGQNYYTKAVYKGQAINAQLPAALNNGLSLKVVKKDTLIYITISCNAAGTAAYTGKPLGLVVKHAGIPVIEKQIQLTDNMASIKIADNILPEGIAAITIYDDQHKPNCERLVYVDHSTHKARLLINTGKTSYTPREKITVNIKATDADKHPVAGYFSLAAVDAGIDKAETSNIAAYMMLQSEIKGQIANANRYFDSTNVNRAKQLDMLMLTQGWRDFVWKRLADTAIKISYLPEQGFTLSGLVKKENGKAVIPNANVTMSIPKARGQKLFFSQTNTTGNYFFDNLQLYGQQVVTVSSRDAKGKPNGDIFLDSLSQHEMPVSIKQAPIFNTAINTELADQMGKRATANKLLDSVTYLKEVKINAGKPLRLSDQNATPSGYADEVLTVTSQDVKDFKTLRQYILYASKQAKPDPQPDQSKNRTIVFFADGKNYTPRIVVDNKEEVFTDEDNNDESVQNHYYDMYYELPMSKVVKVVIKRLLNNLKVAGTSRLISNTPANAMGQTVSSSKSGGISFLYVIYLTLQPDALLSNSGGKSSAVIQGYYEARTFYKPFHATSFDSQKPDLRNTIHWEPEIRTDANGQATVSFYNADPKTNIRIVVQGVTDTGNPLNAVKNYTVK